MPKLKPVTNEEINALVDSAQDVQMRATDLVRRFNINAKIGGAVMNTSALIGVARTLNELAQLLLARAYLDEQERDTEKMLRERVKK